MGKISFRRLKEKLRIYHKTVQSIYEPISKIPMKKELTQLSIDTSTYRTLLCLSRGEEILQEWESEEGPYHGEKILAGIDTLLKQRSIKLKELDFISVGIGPGTFTGLRIGVSSAKFLAEVNGTPLLGIPSLKAQIFNLEEWGEPIEGNPRLWSLTDAMRNEVYVLEEDYENISKLSVVKERTEYALAPEEPSQEVKIRRYTPRKWSKKLREILAPRSPHPTRRVFSLAPSPHSKAR